MDVFGDPELFAEFEKPREPSDRLLMETLKTSKDTESGKQTHLRTDSTGNRKRGHAEFVLGSSEEESGESESDGEENENLQQSQGRDVADGSRDQIEPKDTPTGQNGSSKLHEKDSKIVSDNRGSDHSVISDLRREIERLKKESILWYKYVSWLSENVANSGVLMSLSDLYEMYCY